MTTTTFVPSRYQENLRQAQARLEEGSFCTSDPKNLVNQSLQEIDEALGPTQNL